MGDPGSTFPVPAALQLSALHNNSQVDLQKYLLHGNTLTYELSFEEYEPLPALFLKIKKACSRILAFSNLLMKYQFELSSSHVTVMVIVACWNVVWIRLLMHTQVTSWRIFCSFLCTLTGICACRGLEGGGGQKA